MGVQALSSVAAALSTAFLLAAIVIVPILAIRLFEKARQSRPTRQVASREQTEPIISAHGQDVLMPQMGFSITEGTLTKWLKKIGDMVSIDEALFEISTDKVDAEIPSPVAGILSDIQVWEGTTVRVNTVVCTIGGPVTEGSVLIAYKATEQDERCVLLGVSANCSQEQLRAAFHRQAALWHPDKVAHLAPEMHAFAESRMLMINEAYASLRSASRKST